ncbi:unnamed protein product [Callosobruchus maculatus]|uniref:DUF4794 domain-containing protein n=1 Tax=Callosobruchus maculatus TaxID=64391 RepID=A0A653DB32_CALMS|nr:unnamed protein product [Callosobruchus maculatus]
MISKLVILAAMATLINAEPPRRFNSRFPERQEASPRPEYGPPETPKPVYGPPPKPEYGPPPKPVYGPPAQEPTTQAIPELTTEISTTVNPDAEIIGELNGNLHNGEFGQYYIYHPDGLLQKVRYATVDDMRNMEFSAKLRYENVNPIVGPIYTYDPETYAFSLLN